MKQLTPLLFICMLFMSCSHKYLPIVKTERHYPPVAIAQIVEQVPRDAQYIGTIKMVPRDYSFPTSNDVKIAIENMKEAAANAGARYIYITNIQGLSNDYYSKIANVLTYDWGDGYTIEAELYK